jgi:hypothetical protein
MKKIETSIYIEEIRKERLINASKELGVSMSVLLSYLLKRSRTLFSNKADIFRAVRYQKRTKKDAFTIMHVSLFCPDYEHGVGERLLFKFSVSFIFRLAVDEFLDEILCNGLDEKLKEEDCTTNYFSPHYKVERIEATKSEVWLIRWERTKSRKKNAQNT